MTKEHGLLGLAGICVVTLVLCFAGLVAAAVTGLIGNIDGLLLIMICLMMVGLFVSPLYSIAKDEGWLASGAESEEEASAETPDVEEEFEGHAVGSTRLFLNVWIWLAAITGLEVFLGYERLQPQLMLGLLVALSLVKAALIVTYFMHLRYEKLSLALILVPPTIFCICMIVIFFFPDSWRLMQIRMH